MEIVTMLIWLPETRLDLHMTLIVAIKLKDGYFVAHDGSDHKYIDDEGTTEFETSHQQKVFKVAQNVVFGIAGDADKGLLGVFTEEVEEYFKSEFVDELEVHQGPLGKLVKRFFKINATLLFINHKSLLWLPGSPQLTRNFQYMGQHSGYLASFRSNNENTIFDAPTAAKEAKKIFERVHADNARTGGLITAWVVSQDSTRCEGELTTT